MEYIQKRKGIVEANHRFRLGYMDAKHLIDEGADIPDEPHLVKLFKAKGERYKAGFMLCLKHRKEAS